MSQGSQKDGGEGREYEFSESAIANLLQRLKVWVDVCIDGARQVRPDEVFNPPAISVRELTNAMREVNTDLGFLAQRRPRLQNSGISPGKTGGTLAYRLARHRVFNFDERSCEAKAVEDFPETVILNLVLEALGVNWRADWIQENIGKRPSMEGPLGRRTHVDIVNELSFLLRKRHCNQETLAIVLDSLCLLDSSVREISALKEQNKELRAKVDALVRQGVQEKLS